VNALGQRMDAREGLLGRAILVVTPSPMEMGGMDTPASYVQFGFILISLPNLLVIIGMLVLFAVALVAPFPAHRGTELDSDDPPG
jgi:hypothetical protein